MPYILFGPAARNLKSENANTKKSRRKCERRKDFIINVSANKIAHY